MWGEHAWDQRMDDPPALAAGPRLTPHITRRPWPHVIPGAGVAAFLG